MKIRIFPIILFLAGFMIPTAHAWADSETAILKEIQGQFTSLFSAGRFDELNKLAETYRVDQQKTPAGAWKLTYLYNGVDLLTAVKTEDEWNRLDALATHWMNEKPSPAAYIVYAKINIDRGWFYRGNGYAASISPDQWRQFFECLHKAHEVLSAHKDTASADPEWYRTMIVLAKAEQWNSENSSKLFLEAMQKHKFYHKIYEEIFVGLEPKWGGSYEEMRQFADMAVNYTHEEEGESVYALLYRYVLKCNCKDATVDVMQPDWDKMKTGIADVLKRYPDPWNYNSFASIACMAKDKELTRSLIDQGGQPIYAAWNNDMERYTQCRTVAYSP